MCQPIYVKCENEDNNQCGNPQKKDLQPKGNREKVTMVLGAFKQCPEYDPDTQMCKSKNPKNEEIIVLALRFSIKCAEDETKEAQQNKGSPLSAMEQILLLQKQATAVKGFEREQGVLNMLQGMINDRRVEERENEFELQRAAEADRDPRGTEKVQGGRQKKAPKTLAAEGDDYDAPKWTAKTSAPRGKDLQTYPAPSAFAAPSAYSVPSAFSQTAAAPSSIGSALTNTAEDKRGRKRDASVPPEPASRDGSQARINRTQTSYGSDEMPGFGSGGKKGPKVKRDKDSAPSPAKRGKRSR